jgi:serine/threonine protein kinase
MTQVVVANKYRLVKKIGEGSFGKIFEAKNKDEKEGEERYAIKIMTAQYAPYLENEVAIYSVLKDVKFIPSLYASGSEGKYNYLVMDLLEQSVEVLRADYGAQMSLKVVLHLSIQMLHIVEQIHARGIIHRDLKPANFLIKTNAQQISEIYLIDFGLARSFLDVKGRHYALQTNETLVGTQRYMSVNTHHGLSASRRDDLESLGYMMLFLYHGELPWQNQSSLTDVTALKQGLKLMEKTQQIGEFLLFIFYARNLAFAEKPNYNYLRNLLTNLASIV